MGISKIGLVLAVFCSYAFSESNVIVVQPGAVSKRMESSNNVVNQNQLTIKSTALSSADADWDQLNSITRKQAIKDAENKLNPPIVSSNKGQNSSAISQTTAINIIITSDGYKSATLQFIDGSTLNVELGTKIGKYVVKDILITGVILSSCSSKACKTVNIKRAYPIAPVAIPNANQSPSQYQPTIIYNDNKSDEVPPLTQR